MRKKHLFLLAVYLMTLSSWAQDVINIGTANELATFAERVNGGENSLNAVLTADIDFTAYPETQIGTSDTKFKGTFDGHGHKVTLAYETSADYVGLVRYLDTAGTVKNLVTDGTITTTARYAGGIVGNINGTIQNCASYVTINCSYSGDATNGGLAGRSNGSTVEFCLAAVKIVAPNTIKCGGVVGWLDGVSTIKNCLCITEMELSNFNESDAICRSSNNRLSIASGSNFFLNLYGANNATYNTQVTEEQLASGEICFMLNGDQSDIHWYQTIGEDPYPVLDNTHKPVSATGNLNCMGRSADGSEVTYSNDYKEFIPVHDYVDGICSVCHKANPDACKLEDGYYKIGTAEDLAWFATFMAQGHNDANAKLIADIDFKSYPNTQIGTTAAPFNGIFDGQGHKITLEIVRNGVDYGVLFRVLGASGVIRNLITDGTITTNNQRAAGIVGEVSGRVENCASYVVIEGSKTGDNSSAGIAVLIHAGGIIEFCLSAATISGPSITCCGGIAGWTDGAGTVSNCLSIAELTISPTENPTYASDYICRNNGNLTVGSQNNYYVDTSALVDKPHASSTEVTFDQLASGEVCFLLNGEQRDIHWYQTIGEDQYPVPFPTSKQVFAQGNLNCAGKSADGSSLFFSNTEGSTVPEHKFKDGSCVICGKADPNACELVDGYYQIKDADQLAWFASQVNAGENTINAVLLDDIDYTGYPDGQICGGTNVSYNGIFDGQGHKITIAFVTDQDYAGLFRRLGENGVVKNLTTEGSITNVARYTGGIAGNSNGKIQNCASFITIDCAHVGDATNGGLVGRSNGSVIEFCLSAVKMHAPEAIKCGGIVGWLDGTTTIKNCLCISEFELSNYNESDATCRNNGNLSGVSGNIYFLNLYNTYNTNYCTQIKADQLPTGEICYLLNGDQSDIHWYQTLGEDEMPTLNPESAPVYKIHNTYGNVYDESSFAAFRDEVLANEQEYCANVAAQQTLVEAYAEALPALEQCSDIETLVSTYNSELLPLYDAVAQSEKAYAAYQAKVDEALTYLAENPALDNEKVDELKSYLTEAEEPSDLFPNGTAPYILEEGSLTEEEIPAEITRIDDMLLAAILYSPAAGTNITKLLTNPDFADGFNGWEGKKGTSNGGSPDNVLFAGECWNSTMDMYQTLTDLQNGIYELQVNGAFRPYPSDNRYSTNYAAMLYANGVNNFFQANIEDMILAADAVDGVNCHLTGTNPDLAVTDIDGNVIGYTMYGVIGICNAISAGRYPNSVLVNVTDGTLTVGIKQPGTNNSNDWLGFGNVQLIYHGTMEEATQGLDNTLACMTARANTLLNVYVPSAAEDYQSYPNFSQTQKDQLAATMEAAAAATDNAEKYKLIETFSDLFQQIYESKLAYAKLMKQTTTLADWSSELAPSLSEEEQSEMDALVERLSTAYVEGTATAEDIKKDHLTSLSFVPDEVDGVYQLGTTRDLVMFTLFVNKGLWNSSDAALIADIDLAAYPSLEIGSSSVAYNGVFDGQGHKVTVAFVRDGVAYASLFRKVGEFGVIKNLITDGTITTNNQRATGIAGQLYGQIRNCASFVEITGSKTGDNSHSGIVAQVYAGSSVESCLSAVKIIGAEITCCSGIVGWTEGTSTVSNCLSIAEMTISPTENSTYASDYICRNNGNLTEHSQNNYYVDSSALVDKPHASAIEVTVEQLASGEVCYLLNGDQSEINWYQTIGEDAYPMPFAKQDGTVGKDENGLFINTAIQKIAANKLMRDNIYNLLGQKVQKTRKGVNIIDGKKVLVK